MRNNLKSLVLKYSAVNRTRDWKSGDLWSAVALPLTSDKSLCLSVKWGVILTILCKPPWNLWIETAIGFKYELANQFWGPSLCQSVWSKSVTTQQLYLESTSQTSTVSATKNHNMEQNCTKPSRIYQKQRTEPRTEGPDSICTLDVWGLLLVMLQHHLEDPSEIRAPLC